MASKDSLFFSGLVNTLAPAGTAGTLLLHPEERDGHERSGRREQHQRRHAGEPTGRRQRYDLNIEFRRGAGHIIVSAGVNWTAATTLTLEAERNITINAPITALNGGLTIDAGGTATATDAINIGTFTLADGNWVQNTAALPTFHATDFRILDGSFLRVTGGNGTSANPYQITDVYGLQGIGSSDLLASNFISGQRYRRQRHGELERWRRFQTGRQLQKLPRILRWPGPHHQWVDRQRVNNRGVVRLQQRHNPERQSHQRQHRWRTPPAKFSAGWLA